MRLAFVVLAAVLAATTVVSAGTNVPPTSSGGQKIDKRYVRVKPWDCHRDARTHRIGGVMVTHRHVGDNCQIRVVRKSTG